MDYAGKAARFRERAQEIRGCTATIKGEDSRKEAMRLVGYYEQMAASFERLAKPQT